MHRTPRLLRLGLLVGVVATLVAGAVTLSGCSPPGDEETKTEELGVYFISNGENALAVTREVTEPEDSDLATVAMEELLAGLTEQELETQPALSTGIPESTELLGVTIDGDTAKVDLSSDFEEGAGTSMETNSRVAQVVYTVTDIDGISAVLFRMEGAPVDSFGDNGLDLSMPQPASEWEDTIPIDA